MNGPWEPNVHHVLRSSGMWRRAAPTFRKHSSSTLKMEAALGTRMKEEQKKYKKGEGE
jgi:hypothetical protein